MDKSQIQSNGGAKAYLPEKLTLPLMQEAVDGCRGCDLYKHATQAVFGEGARKARVMFVGEQPGDQEDKQGKPFVGPAGALLNKAMEEAGIVRSDAYVTNAVKHFKFEMRGKKRLHSKPNAAQVKACQPWLEAEIKVVQPELIVCMGATAAQSLMGPAFRVTKQRGEVLDNPWAPGLVATVHPSSILRAPDHDAREQAYKALVADLSVVARHLKKSKPARELPLAKGRFAREERGRGAWTYTARSRATPLPASHPRGPCRPPGPLTA
jgi:uracil-DNA glycosylase